MQKAIPSTKLNKCSGNFSPLCCLHIHCRIKESSEQYFYALTSAQRRGHMASVHTLHYRKGEHCQTAILLPRDVLSINPFVRQRFRRVPPHHHWQCCLPGPHLGKREKEQSTTLNTYSTQPERRQ